MAPPDDDRRATLERLEACFLDVTRKGLALRSADIDVLRDWIARGVPEDVVRRGIAEGIRRFLATAEPSAPLPSVLRYYRTHVEAAFATHRRAVEQGRIVATTRPGGTARGAPAVDLSAGLGLAARRWLQVRRDEAGEAARAVWDGALATLEALPAGRSIVEALEALDDAILADLLAAAPDDARQRVEARVRAIVDDARRRGAGPEARADLEQAERRQAAADECGFASVLEAALEHARTGPIGGTT